MPPRCVRKRLILFSSMPQLATMYTHDLQLIVLSRNKLRNSALQIPGKRKSINALAKLPHTKSNVFPNHHKFFSMIVRRNWRWNRIYFKSIFISISLRKIWIKIPISIKDFEFYKNYRSASRLLTLHSRKRTLKQIRIERITRNVLVEIVRISSSCSIISFSQKFVSNAKSRTMQHDRGISYMI